jgi:cytochrome c oxidase assembly factor CtaG
MTAVLALPAHAAADEAGGGVLAVLLLAVLAAVAAAYLAGLRRYAGRTPSWAAGARRFGAWRVGCFLAALALLALALGPMDGLADERFSWHMAQHMLLAVAAAPLLAAGAPAVPLLLMLPVRWRAPVARVRVALRRAPGVRVLYLPVTAWILQVAVLWGWHLPGAYAAAETSPLLHALEHALFIGTAWMFWWHMLAAGRRRMSGLAAVVYSFAATLPMAALGAVLTLAPKPLYPGLAAQATAAGFDPLTDQQLAGLIMWIPPDVVYLAMTVVLFLPWFTRYSEPEAVLAAPEEGRLAPVLTVPAGRRPHEQAQEEVPW